MTSRAAEKLEADKQIAIERGWVTAGTKCDDPEIFKFRPSKTKSGSAGYAYTTLEGLWKGTKS